MVEKLWPDFPSFHSVNYRMGKQENPKRTKEAPKAFRLDATPTFPKPKRTVHAYVHAYANYLMLNCPCLIRCEKSEPA